MQSVVERANLICKAEHSWLDYQELLAGLTDEDLERSSTVGFWSGRDLVAHIACWERHCAWLLTQWSAGRERLYSYDFDQSDMQRWDEWNEGQVAPLRALTLDGLLEFALEAHFNAMAKVATATSVDEAFLGGMTWSHYEWHHGDIANIKKVGRHGG